MPIGEEADGAKVKISSNEAEQQSPGPHVNIEAPTPQGSRLCAGGCGFQATWHATHCCVQCTKGEGSHGGKCEKKQMPCTKAEDLVHGKALKEVAAGTM